MNKNLEESTENLENKPEEPEKKSPDSNNTDSNDSDSNVSSNKTDSNIESDDIDTSPLNLLNIDDNKSNEIGNQQPKPIISKIIIVTSVFTIAVSFLAIIISIFVIFRYSSYKMPDLLDIIKDSEYSNVVSPSNKDDLNYISYPIQNFIYVVRKGSADDIRSAIQSGINPNGKFTTAEQGDKTALWIALNNHRPWEVIKALLENNAKWLPNSTKAEDISMVRSYSRIIPNFDTLAMNSYLESIGYNEKSTPYKEINSGRSINSKKITKVKSVKKSSLKPSKKSKVVAKKTSKKPTIAKKKSAKKSKVTQKKSAKKKIVKK